MEFLIIIALTVALVTFFSKNYVGVLAVFGAMLLIGYADASPQASGQPAENIVKLVKYVEYPEIERVRLVELFIEPEKYSGREIVITDVTFWGADENSVHIRDGSFSKAINSIQLSKESRRLLFKRCTDMSSRVSNVCKKDFKTILVTEENYKDYIDTRGIFTISFSSYGGILDNYEFVNVELLK